MKNVLVIEPGTIETVVEGTRFLVTVAPQGPVSVQVEQGRVRLRRADGGEVQLPAHRQAQLPLEGPASEVLRWRPSPEDMARTWPLGRPRLLLDGFVAGQIPVEGSLGGALRLSAGLRLPARLRLVLEGGLGAEGGSLRVPGSLGLSWQAGTLVLGGVGSATLDQERYDCGGDRLALHLGGAGFVRAERAMSRRLCLLAELRVGYADGLRVEPGLGLGVGL